MPKPKLCVDHLGNKFDSEKEMCQHWNIEQTTFRIRQKRDWSLEKSLCTKTIKHAKPCVDHLGNKFDSINDMCQYWDINSRTFRIRQKRRWSLEESLYGKNVTDHLGNKFDSIAKMCQHWKVESATFRARQKHNWSLSESLGVIPRLKVTTRISKTSFQNYHLTPNITIIDNVPDTDCYFICLINNKDKTIYHRSELIDEYIKYNKKQKEAIT